MTQDIKQRESPKRKLAFRKKLCFLAMLFIGLLLVMEVGARVVFFAMNDFNPFYLQFGFVPSIEAGAHDNVQAGYSKFFPGRSVREKYKGKTIVMQINGDGFRSLKEFERPKPKGTFRIVTLGGSSTFGYHVADEETYAHRLEAMLRQSIPGRKIEVFNLGVPHATSKNILALAQAELASLEPDLVTLYSGYNDAILYKGEVAGVYRFKDWLYDHSVLWRVVHPGVKRVHRWIIEKSKSDVFATPNLNVPVKMSKEEVDEIRLKVAGRYRANIEGLIDFADEIGCTVLPVTQSMTLRHWSASGFADSDYTYAEELATVQEALKEEGGVVALQVILLNHHEIMTELAKIASQRDLRLVDGIGALEDHRDQLLSYVHLSKKGNEVIARRIHDAILEHELMDESDAEASSSANPAGFLRVKPQTLAYWRGNGIAIVSNHRMIAPSEPPPTIGQHLRFVAREPRQMAPVLP